MFLPYFFNTPSPSCLLAKIPFHHGVIRLRGGGRLGETTAKALGKEDTAEDGGISGDRLPVIFLYIIMRSSALKSLNNMWCFVVQLGV